MAQPPHQPPNRPTPGPPKPPLKDPAEGKSPAIGGGHLARTDEPAPRAPPDPPVETIADEQRRRSAEIEEMGVEAWKASMSDDAPPEGEATHRQVPGVGFKEPSPEGNRKLEHHAETRK